jgi:hypothetical protein
VALFSSGDLSLFLCGCGQVWRLRGLFGVLGRALWGFRAVSVAVRWLHPLVVSVGFSVGVAAAKRQAFGRIPSPVFLAVDSTIRIIGFKTPPLCALRAATLCSVSGRPQGLLTIFHTKSLKNGIDLGS